MSFEIDDYRVSKEVVLLLKGVSGRGLFFKEWRMPNGWLVAVGKAPEGIDPDDIEPGDAVALAEPGFGDTRLRALTEAVNGWVQHEEARQERQDALGQVAEAPFAINGEQAEIAIAGLQHVLAARTPEAN